MNPNENGNPRNDLLRIVNQYRNQYPEGASSIEAVVGALVESDLWPVETVLDPEDDSTPPSQRNLEDGSVVDHSEFKINLNKGKVEMKNGAIFELAYYENEILSLLASQPGHYFTMEEISNDILGYYDVSSGNSLRTVISRLRKKIPLYDEKGDHRVIRSRVKFGYMFDPLLESKPELNEQVIERF